MFCPFFLFVEDKNIIQIFIILFFLQKEEAQLKDMLSQRFSAPETLESRISHPPSDIWMLGLAFWQMLVIDGGKPFAECDRGHVLATLDGVMRTKGEPVPVTWNDSGKRKKL